MFKGFFDRIKFFKIVLVFTARLFFSFSGYCQSLGDPIVNITFGSGSSKLAGPLAADSGSTTYTYSSGQFPNDGSYTIANTTSAMNSGWNVTSDHTGNTNGYMMIVNASVAPGIFYTRTVMGLCGNTKYQFAAWIKNLLNYVAILPNVTFSIETTKGVVLGTGNTGNILTGDKWIQYPFTFTTPATADSIVIKMTNNAPGGAGNDIAIDDITFRPYGAEIVTSFDQTTTQGFCAGTVKNITINTSSSLPAGYSQKVQLLVKKVWVDQTPASTAASFTIPAPTTFGIYYYRIVSGQSANINTSECVVASNQLNLTVTGPPTAGFAAVDTACFGSPVAFKDTSVANSGSIISWKWDFGDGGSDSSKNPAHTYLTAGDFKVKLTVNNTAGCGTGSIIKMIHIRPNPAASFVFSTPDCATSAVAFTDQSTTAEGKIISWVWNYGDSTATETKTTSAAFQHTFIKPGVYPVSLTINTNNGCSATIKQNLTISPLPVVNFGTPDVCLADASALFTDSTTIADKSKLTYLWNFGDGNATGGNPNTSTLQKPSHKYTKAAVYQVSLTVTSATGCTLNRTKTFTVNGSIPSAAFTVLNPTTLCSNREVFFVNNSIVDFGNITKIQMIYDFGNNATVIESDEDPYPGKLYRHTYPEFHISPASKNYQVRMLAYSGGTCVSQKDQTITILATPMLMFTAPAAVCNNDNAIQFIGKETSGITGAGIFTGNGITSAGLFTPAKVGVGKAVVSYIYTANNACADTISQTIMVNQSPSVFAGKDTTVLEGGSATLKATAVGDSLTYNWSPATYLSNSDTPNPVVTPVNDIIYTLTVTNPQGCSASSKIKVTALKSPVIPNTFTPNGDGINDTWNIKYLGSYAGATIEVFNRFGQKVYSSIGYPVPWDGRRNNAEVPAGTYYYVINPMHGRKAFSGWVGIIR